MTVSNSSLDVFTRRVYIYSTRGVFRKTKVRSPRGGTTMASTSGVIVGVGVGPVAVSPAPGTEEGPMGRHTSQTPSRSTLLCTGPRPSTHSLTHQVTEQVGLFPCPSRHLTLGFRTTPSSRV